MVITTPVVPQTPPEYHVHIIKIVLRSQPRIHYYGQTMYLVDGTQTHLGQERIIVPVGQHIAT